jgi:hypothetical protein
MRPARLLHRSGEQSLAIPPPAPADLVETEATRLFEGLLAPCGNLKASSAYRASASTRTSASDKGQENGDKRLHTELPDLQSGQ